MRGVLVDEFDAELLVIVVHRHNVTESQRYRRGGVELGGQRLEHRWQQHVVGVEEDEILRIGTGRGGAGVARGGGPAIPLA
jgi:hypothetical protein